MIVFIPGGFIVGALIFGAGAIYSIIENISGIVYMIWGVCAFFLGWYVTLYVTFSEKRSALWRITYIVQGLWISVAELYIHWLYIIAMGYGNRSTECSFFYKFLEKYDITFVAMTMSIVSILVVAVLIEVAKSIHNKRISRVFQILAILAVCIIAVGGFRIARRDEFQNSQSCFEFDGFKYETVEKTVAKKSLFGKVYWDSYVFEEGTQLYGSNKDHTIEEEKYVLVSDGEKMGFVKKSTLKSLYEKVHVTTEDTELYDTEEREQVKNTWYGSWTETVKVATDHVIGMVQAGTQVVYKREAGDGYVLVELPNGMEGAIKEECVELKKIMNE